MKMRWLNILFLSAIGLPAFAADPKAPPSSTETITPGEWLKAQPKPQFREGHTLPPLSRFSWEMDERVIIELATDWGYALEFGVINKARFENALTKPESPEGKLITLALSDPKRYRLSACSPRIMPTMPSADVWTRNAEGQFLNGSAKSLDGTVWNPKLKTVYSPASPDSYWEEAGQMNADRIRKLNEKCPIAILLNTGEYGLGTTGFGQKVWEQDPHIVKAKGDKSWEDYISERKGHYQGIMSKAEKDAAPNRLLYVYYTAGGGTDCGVYPTWSKWQYKWESMKTISDIPNNQAYYLHFNNGWTGQRNLLTLCLNAAAREITDGKPLSYNWLSGGWEGEAGHKLSDIDRWTGFLKCYYTAGMIGGNTGYYQFLGPKGFSKPFHPDKPPHWLLQLTSLAHVHALFSHSEEFLRNGDLLPGPNKHHYSKNLPAFELPTGDDTLRVLARKHRQRAEWLVTAWAADGDERNARATIPELGNITVRARPSGSMYHIAKRDGRWAITQLDAPPKKVLKPDR